MSGLDDPPPVTVALLCWMCKSHLDCNKNIFCPRAYAEPQPQTPPDTHDEWRSLNDPA